MRHRVAFRKLNRTSSHRLAMLGNMVSSLLEHEAIRTTVPKAKEARRVAERIITLGKRGGLANVRLAARTVHDKNLLQKVFGDLRDRYAERQGGYTRIVRLGYRPGDSAEIALLELVDRSVPEEKGAAADKKAKESAAPAGEGKKAKAEKKAKPAVAEPGKKPRARAKREAAAPAEGQEAKASRSRKKTETPEEKGPEGKAKKPKSK